MIPNRYDALFRSYAPDIPLAFLRSLAWNESRMLPSAISRAGARGLLQVMPVVLADYNRANGTAYGSADLHRPDVNVAVGTWLLRLIVREYARNHPRTLATNWSDARWAQLVVLGWNRGFSERAGVSMVVGQLEREGWPAGRITASAVVQNAARFGAAPTLRDDAMAIRWSSGVVADYGRGVGAGVVRASAGPVGVVALVILAGLVVRSVLL